ncbi:hypothetical protein Tco_0707460 [Tanacetum coccineum]|uniref:Reverse transcriptase domain-containing protein n=1 Tax=Tanacetum coccineum TaxID=301880 RepID=A0ABQ4YAB3_9ASTR
MNSPSSSGSLPSNTVANPRGDLKAITTRSGVSYDEPTIPTTSSPLSKEVEREPEATKDKVQTTNLGSTAHVQPLVVQVPIPEPDFLQIFQRLHFDLSFADALLHMPKFASTFKSLISNKEKLFELTNTPLNKNCSAMLLKKLPEKLRDPDKFLIPCVFPELDECLARNSRCYYGGYTYYVGITSSTHRGLRRCDSDFVVIDYDVDPRVPLILGRPFLRTARALVDVFGEELILRDEDEKLIFHADNTSKHPQNHANESINMINFIDITCEDRFSKVLKFKKSNHPSSGSTTPLSDSLPSLTPFETNDSLLEEFADELALHDPFPPRNEYDNFDPKADLRKIEYLLNREPSTESSPMTDIEIIDPILERFTDEPAHVYSPPPGDDDDDNDDLFMTSLLILPTMEPEDSLIMGDENLSTILEKKSDEFIKSSVEDLVSIPRESKDTSDSDKECDFPFSVTFSNPFSDANEDECFDPGGDIDEIDAFLDIDVSTDIEDGYHDSEGDVIYLECLLTNDTIPNLPPEVFLDHDSRSLKDEPDNDLKSMVKFLDLEIHEKISLKYVRLPFEDRHYFFLTFVFKIFLPFLTYPVNSLLFLSSGSEDTIFDPDISAYSFYSLEPVAYENLMMIFPFFCFCPKDKGIQGEYEDQTDMSVRGTRWQDTSVRGVYGSVPIIGNHEAVGGVQKDYNTPRSSNMSGGVLERTKLPLPLGGYKWSTQQLFEGLDSSVVLVYFKIE